MSDGYKARATFSAISLDLRVDTAETLLETLQDIIDSYDTKGDGVKFSQLMDLKAIYNALESKLTNGIFRRI